MINSFTLIILKFCTYLSTEKVNKIGFYRAPLFITSDKMTSYPSNVGKSVSVTSGLPSVGSVKQSVHLCILKLIEVVR